MLACHCLNVIIESEDDDFQKVTVEMLGLTTEQQIQDGFFNQELLQVGKLININKTHSGLIQTRNVGPWVVHYCINCRVHSHAVHREKGASCVIVNSLLLADKAIERLRATDKLSPLYNIIINANGIAEDDVITNNYLPTEVENIIKGLKQIASDVLKNELLAVEERIRQYTEEQYTMLGNLREKAFREQQALTRIIINNTVDDTKPISTNLPMANNNPQGMPLKLNEPLAAGSVSAAPRSPNVQITTTRHAPKRQKSCPAGRFDTETLFQLDGIEDVRSDDLSEVEESDIEEVNKDEGGGMKIPRSQRSNSISIAKSLPMTIPHFLSQARQGRNRAIEDVDDVGPVLEDRTLDIAASIKALAKSVHGDPVFGDLPKPRYTYI